MFILNPPDNEFTPSRQLLQKEKHQAQSRKIEVSSA